MLGHLEVITSEDFVVVVVVVENIELHFCFDETLETLDVAWKKSSESILQILIYVFLANVAFAKFAKCAQLLKNIF